MPWMVITDAAGKELVTSEGPEGNCGCPVTPPEREWFMTMIRRTAQNLEAADVAKIEAALAEYAKAFD